MARIQRCGNRCTEIHVAQSHDQVAGLEYDAAHIVHGGKAVDAPDELDVVRAPGRIPAHRLHVAFGGQARGGVVPRERQMHDAARYAHGIGVGQVIQSAQHMIDCLLLRQAARIEVHLQRADARCQFQQAIEWLGAQAIEQRLHLGSAARDRAPVRRIRSAGCLRRIGVCRSRMPRRSRQFQHHSRIAGSGLHSICRGQRCGVGCGQAGNRRVLCQQQPGGPGRASRRESARDPPGLSCPVIHRSARQMVTGQTNPPRLGPSGPRITGMSPVEVDRARA